MQMMPSGVRIVSVGHVVTGSLLFFGAAWVASATTRALGPLADYAAFLFLALIAGGGGYWLVGWRLWVHKSQGPRAVKLPEPGWLTLKPGPGQASRRVGIQQAMRIGRAPDCDIRLDDDRVSHSHARVEVENGQVYVHDLGSRTGTWVNDRPVQRHLLYDGAHIRVGNATFEFKKAIAR